MFCIKIIQNNILAPVNSLLRQAVLYAKHVSYKFRNRTKNAQNTNFLWDTFCHGNGRMMLRCLNLWLCVPTAGKSDTFLRSDLLRSLSALLCLSHQIGFLNITNHKSECGCDLVLRHLAWGFFFCFFLDICTILFTLE